MEENVVIELEEHLFRWDEVKWEEATEKDKKRIIEFIIHNYAPNLSLTEKLEKPDPKTIKITDEKNTFFLTLGADKSKTSVQINKKTDELIVNKDIDKKDSKEFIVYPTNTAQGSGNRFAGLTGIVLTFTSLFFLSLVIINSPVQFWPHPMYKDEDSGHVVVLSNGISGNAQALTNENAKNAVIISNDGSTRTQMFTDEKTNSSNSSAPPVTFFQWTLEPTDEERLLFIVALAGAFGSSVHALRPFYWYVGNRGLIMSWLAMYLLLPVIVSLLGFIFYTTIRVGLFPQATIRQTNPFAFVAISAPVGMFSVQAALKLQDIAETVFAKAGQGRESKPKMREEDKCGKN